MTALLERRFVPLCCSVAAVALGVRLVYVHTVGRRINLVIDSVWYELTAGSLADGDGYIDPSLAFRGVKTPTAGWPPLYPAFLALVRLVFGHGASQFAFQTAGAVVGSLTVLMVGLLGRRLAGPVVGLVAAALAGLYPLLIAVDASVMSETIFVPLVLAALLVSLRADRPATPWRYVVLGLLLGAAALTRNDAVILAPLLIAATLWSARTSVRPQRLLVLGGLALVGFAMVVAPWLIRNQVRLGEPTLSTISSSTAVAGANCGTVYHGRLTGFWSLSCIVDGGGISELERSRRDRHRGLSYARSHISRLPAVVTTRVLRAWGVYRPMDQLRLESVESRSHRTLLLGWLAYAPVAVLAVVGFVRVARAKAPILPLLAVLASVTTTAATGYGNQRFRAIAEPVLVALAAVTIVAIVDMVRRRRSAAAAPLPEPAPASAPSGHGRTMTDNMAWSLARVSASSVAGSLSATIPLPP